MAGPQADRTQGITQPKDQYAMYVFGWDYATLGPLGIFQAVFRFLVLVVLTPCEYSMG